MFTPGTPGTPVTPPLGDRATTSRRTSTRRRATTRRLAAAFALVTAAALAGCDTPAPSVAAPTPTEAPIATPQTTTYRLDTDVWYAGLVLHLDLATAQLDSRGGTVDVAFRIDNPTDEDGDLDAKITLVVAGNRIVPTRESHVPTTPAGATSLGLLTFELQGIASAADGVLQIGGDPDHVAIVPFLPASGDPVTFQPIEKALKGSGAAGAIEVTLRHAQLRWDLPDWNQELAATLGALTITYDVANHDDFSGGFAFTGDNIQLKLPNGKLIDARPDGHSQSIELIGPNATKRALFSRFEIPSNAKGKFTLIVRNGSAQGSVSFTIGS